MECIGLESAAVAIGDDRAGRTDPAGRAPPATHDTRLTHESLVHVVGHRGLAGSAITRALRAAGVGRLLHRGSDELDLRDAAATEAFYAAHRPTHVVLAAARVGGIVANQRQPVEFLGENLAIQANVIGAAARHGARRLVFLGSSCIYPKHAPQPLREHSLLSGPLEPTNRAYALAKIAGIEMCWAWNRQHGKRFLCVMPTNLYGPGDNWHPEHSHVVPGMIRRFHEAKRSGAPHVVVWGSGTPRREFLHSDDFAAACVRLMSLPDARFDALLGSDEAETGRFEPPVINVGSGRDLTIAELAALVARVVGYQGEIVFDASRPDGTPRKLMDNSRISALGWRPAIGLEEGLVAAYHAFLRGEGRGLDEPRI